MYRGATSGASSSAAGASAPSSGARTVFVGNVAWEATEEDVTAIFRTVGPLQSFRLMLDKDTGKPRGFGFAEFIDPESAASAVRNLNGYDINGRQIRVDFSDSDQSSSKPGSGGAGRSGGGGGGGGGGGDRDMRDFREREREMQRERERERELQRERERERERERDRDPRLGSVYWAEHPDIPMGAPLPPGVYATDHIGTVVDSISKEQQLDIIAHMKVVASTQPDQARALLQGNPQLAYAVLTTMMTCGLVDAPAIQRIVQQQQPPPISVVPPQQSMLPPPQGGYDANAAARIHLQAQAHAQAQAMAMQQQQQHHQQQQQQQHQQQQQQQQHQHQQQQQQQQQHHQQQQISSQMGAAMGGLNPMIAAAVAANPFFSTPQGQALLVQVVTLTHDQLQQLPPDQKSTVLQLRAQLGMT